MTMKREAKKDAEQILKGHKQLTFASPKNRKMCREQGRGYEMTPAEYAKEYLGRRNVNSETASLKKMERQGWVLVEGTGSFRKLTRR
jgi:hypothetical protein